MARAVRDQLSRKPKVIWPIDQDQRDQDRRQVAVVDAEPRGAAGGRRHSGGPRWSRRLLQRVHAVRRAGARSSSVLPEGQRTTAFSTHRARARGRSAAGAGSGRRSPSRPRPPAPAARRSSAPSPRRRWRCGSCRPAAARRRGIPLEVEGDPVAAGRHVVAVEQQRPALVGDHHVEHAAVAQVGQRHRAAVVPIVARRPSAPRRGSGPRRR